MNDEKQLPEENLEAEELPVDEAVELEEQADVMLDAAEIEDEEVEETLTFTLKRSTIYLALMPVVFLAGLLVGFLVWGRGAPNAVTVNAGGGAGEDGAQAAAESAGEVVVPEDVPRYEIDLYESDPRDGAEDAPVVIIEFSDFECPYCQRHIIQVKPQIMAEYGDQVLYIHKDFPLTSIHPNAVPAAEAAMCAHEQGEFWAFHDLLFSGQGLGDTMYASYAEQLGLDMGQFNECLDEGRYSADVQADFEFASNLGVRSTPTFFINGIPVVGAQPYEVFQQVIESELSN